LSGKKHRESLNSSLGKMRARNPKGCGRGRGTALQTSTCGTVLSEGEKISRDQRKATPALASSIAAIKRISGPGWDAKRGATCKDRKRRKTLAGIVVWA